jgi:hypothetical protein
MELIANRHKKPVLYLFLEDTKYFSDLLTAPKIKSQINSDLSSVLKFCILGQNNLKNVDYTESDLRNQIQYILKKINKNKNKSNILVLELSLFFPFLNFSGLLNVFIDVLSKYFNLKIHYFNFSLEDIVNSATKEKLIKSKLIERNNISYINCFNYLLINKFSIFRKYRNLKKLLFKSKNISIHHVDKNFNKYLFLQNLTGIITEESIQRKDIYNQNFIINSHFFYFLNSDEFIVKSKKDKIKTLININNIQKIYSLEEKPFFRSIDNKFISLFNKYKEKHFGRPSSVYDQLEINGYNFNFLNISL